MDPGIIDKPHVYEDMVLPGPVYSSSVDRVKMCNFLGDVVVASYPKTGTTWVLEIAWLVCNRGDVDTAKKVNDFLRVQYLEFFDFASGKPILDSLDEIPRPAVFKSHLPGRFFTKQLADNGNKFIVVGRNPKDALVSFYHFYRSFALTGKYKGSWNEFFQLFKEEGLIYGDFFKWYEDWWPRTEKQNVLFMKYEDMKRNLFLEVKRIAAFLGKNLPDEQMKRIAEHGDFNAMKNNKTTNKETVPREFYDHKISPFMRSGQVGDWKNYFSAEQSALVDHLYDTRLKPMGLFFDFE